MKVDFHTALYFLNSTIDQWNRDVDKGLNLDSEPFVFIKIFKKMKNRNALLEEMKKRHLYKLKEIENQLKISRSSAETYIEHEIRSNQSKILVTKTKEIKVKKARSKPYDKPKEFKTIETVTVVENFMKFETSNIFCCLEIEDEPDEISDKFGSMETINDHKNNITIKRTYTGKETFDNIINFFKRPLEADQDENEINNLIKDKSILPKIQQIPNIKFSEEIENVVITNSIIWVRTYHNEVPNTNDHISFIYEINTAGEIIINSKTNLTPTMFDDHCVRGYDDDDDDISDDRSTNSDY